jgi:hypothetical protein
VVVRGRERGKERGRRNRVVGGNWGWTGTAFQCEEDVGDSFHSYGSGLTGCFASE